MSIYNALKLQKPNTPFQPGDKIISDTGVIVIVTRCSHATAVGFILQHPDIQFRGKTITANLTDEYVQWTQASEEFLSQVKTFQVGEFVGADVDDRFRQLMVVDVNHTRTEYICVDIATADDYTLSVDRLTGINQVEI